MRHRSAGALVAVRLVLVANGALLSVLGVIFLAYYQRPESFLFAGATWVGAGVLFFCTRYTDPYRVPPKRRRR